MELIETSLFTRLIHEYLTDDEYYELQIFLIDNPESGDLMKGTGGLRKIRWKTGVTGKRGGIRIIYYWLTNADKIFLLTIYAKNEVSDLRVAERKILKQIVEEIKNG